MAKTLTDEPNNGWWIEFRRGWWARCLGPNKDCKERGETSATYHGSVTEEDAKELEKRVGDFLGKRGWPDGDAQVEIMRGGADVKITVDGSTHVRSVREWHALAVASFRSVPTAAADRITEHMVEAAAQRMVALVMSGLIEKPQIVQWQPWAGSARAILEAALECAPVVESADADRSKPTQQEVNEFGIHTAEVLAKRRASGCPACPGIQSLTCKYPDCPSCLR